MQPKYRRVLVKLSGEALAGSEGFGLDPKTLKSVCQGLKSLYDMGVEVAVVVGGGNFWRGRFGDEMDKSSADYMGMLATVINGMALQDTLEKLGVQTRVQSAIAMNTICEPFIKRKAIRHLEKNRIVVFAAGTGNPFFTTDTAAALRAAEIGAQAILLAKNVDAVYDRDPKEDSSAVKFKELTYNEVLQKDLKVMDQTAITLCKENSLPILVFGLEDPHNLLKAVTGENPGTIVR